MTLTTLRCHAIDTPELLEESIAQAIQHRDNLNLLPAHQKRSGIAIRLSPYSVMQIVRTGTGIKLISYILLACIAILFQSIKVRIRIYKWSMHLQHQMRSSFQCRPLSGCGYPTGYTGTGAANTSSLSAKPFLMRSAVNYIQRAYTISQGGKGADRAELWFTHTCFCPTDRLLHPRGRAFGLWWILLDYAPDCPAEKYYAMVAEGVILHG